MIGIDNVTCACRLSVSRHAYVSKIRSNRAPPSHLANLSPPRNEGACFLDRSSSPPPFCIVICRRTAKGTMR